MGLTHFKHWFPLLAVLLTACATATPVVQEGDEAPDVVYSWEGARADPSCVVPLCDEERLRHWQCSLRPKEPYEKHHIFPQAVEFALWFKRQGIDIHAFTIRLPKSFHQWLHSGGSSGGQWNEAWRRFRRGKEGATAEQMWAFAGELMSRFGVNGPLMPYYCD